MRASTFIVALAGLAIFATGMKVFTPLSSAQGNVPAAATLDVLQMQVSYAQPLPAQQMHDMTFVLD